MKIDQEILNIFLKFIFFIENRAKKELVFKKRFIFLG